jgi:hypothetical protein
MSKGDSTKKQKQPAQNADTNSRPDLKIDWCTHEAAKYAVEHWHYSKRMPKSKLAKFGVWESGKFVGVVIFGVGATPEIAKPFGLKPTEVCELVRVALTKHKTPVSRIIAITLTMLKTTMSGLRVVVSFADTSQGHHGGIYQAGGWFLTGSTEYHAYRVKGEVVHPRVCHLRYGKGGQSIPWLRLNVDPNAERVRNGVKHKYVMPLDNEMRKQIEPLRKPYPKRVRSVDSDTSGDQPEMGGANPTRTLSKSGD